MTNPLTACNLFLGFCPPPRTLAQICKEQTWETFHEDLLNEGQSVGRVAEVIQYLLDTVRRPDIPFEKHSEFFKKGGKIDNLDISGKFESYLETKIYSSNISREEADKYSINLAANLLRGLRYIKEGKPVLQLPEQDKCDLVEFISTFSFPPLDRFYRE